MAKLKVGDLAPLFEAETHENKLFKLKDQEGSGWIVLYFYPKADTPGCTKQACSFRDNVEILDSTNARVYGISSDSPEKLKKFHDKYKLNFILLSDTDSSIIDAYGTKMPLLNASKRVTFILDSTLTIRSINTKVDPAGDPKTVYDEIVKIQGLH